MPATMRTFVMREIGAVGCMEKPIPDPGPNDAIIKTTAALICTSDVHTVGGAIGPRTNMTLGHEAVGRIHKLGSAVAGLKEGDRVAVSAITPCYQCENCLRGCTSQCTTMLGGWKFANVKDGNMAEYFHVNSAQANLAPIPDSLTDEQAVYATDMLSTGFMGAEHARIPIGGTVAVFAQGPVGLMATVGAQLLGAGLVIAVESVPQRMALARRFGADEVIDFTARDPVEAILELTGGPGSTRPSRRSGPWRPSRPVSRRRVRGGRSPMSVTTDMATWCRSHASNGAWAWATRRSGRAFAPAALSG